MLHLQFFLSLFFAMNKGLLSHQEKNENPTTCINIDGLVFNVVAVVDVLAVDPEDPLDGAEAVAGVAHVQPSV